MKIAVFLPNWLGDLVMATPVVRALHRRFGEEGHLIGILQPKLADVLAGTDWLDELWHYDRRSKNRELRMSALAWRMRREKMDKSVLLTNSFSSAMAAYLGGSRERIGYVRYARGPLLTQKIYPARDGRRIVPEPIVDSYLSIAEAAGCPSESPRLELATSDEEERMADETFAKLGLRTDGRVVILNPGGAYGAAKLWPWGYFGTLARRIVSELDHDVLVMCGPAERRLAKAIVDASGSPRVFSMADQEISIPRAKACIRRGRIMVSTDSGPRHIAAAYGLPVITLFGSTLPVWIENPTQQAVHVMSDIDCLGCAKRECPLGHHRCMWSLKPDRVFLEVVSLLQITEIQKVA